MANGMWFRTTDRRRPFAAVLGVAGLLLALTACDATRSVRPTAVSSPASAGTGSDGVSAGAVAQQPLLGRWRLVSLQPPGQGVQAVPNGTAFTTEFGSDAVVRSVADCNRCSAGYSAGVGTLAVTPMACTRAYCVASAPYDTTFATLLQSSREWQLRGVSLELHGDAGSMTFVR
jgi:heat shock protein HslJ